MTVEKNKLRAPIVQAGMNKIGSADGGQVFAVKQPDYGRRLTKRRNAN